MGPATGAAGVTAGAAEDLARSFLDASEGNPLVRINKDDLPNDFGRRDSVSSSSLDRLSGLSGTSIGVPSCWSR